MKLLVLYLDAWPYRYKEILVDTIASVDNDFSIARLIPVYGYTDCFKVTFLTGKYPYEHGYWVSYRFTRRRRTRPLPGFLSFVLDRDVMPVRVFRFVLNKFINIHMLHVKAWGYVDTSGVHPEAPLISIDSYLRSRGMDTLFGLLERQGLSYIVVEDRFYGHRLDRLAKVVFEYAHRYDVIFVYIDEPDFWGHRYGVDDPHYVSLLEWLTSIVKKFVELARLHRASYIIFSDHGMATVRRFINVYDLVLRDPGYGKDYVVGIDATFLRIFYLRDKPVKSEILSQLKKIMSYVALKLTEQDLERYRLPRDRSYGDEVYALREGVVFFPNFFSWLRPYGMHAYSPDYESQHGIIVASSDVRLNQKSIDVPGLHQLVSGVVRRL